MEFLWKDALSLGTFLRSVLTEYIYFRIYIIKVLYNQVILEYLLNQVSILLNNIISLIYLYKTKDII